MISALQQAGLNVPLFPTAENVEDTTRFKESKILQALATLLVKNNEVVAMTGVQGERSIDILTYFATANPRKASSNASLTSGAADYVTLEMKVGGGGEKEEGEAILELMRSLWETRPFIPGGKVGSPNNWKGSRYFDRSSV